MTAGDSLPLVETVDRLPIAQARTPSAPIAKQPTAISFTVPVRASLGRPTIVAIRGRTHNTSQRNATDPGHLSQ
jgi:hypothetical protein